MIRPALLLAVALPVLLAASSSPQQGAYKRDVPDSLAKLVKVPESTAVATARKRIPKGTVQSLELEREKGRLIWSMDMTVPGKSGTDEINVSAISGRIVGVEHESAKAEGAEARAESTAAAKKAAKKPMSGKAPPAKPRR
jgi:Peptidase propeptide and YPEB domain